MEIKDGDGWRLWFYSKDADPPPWALEKVELARKEWDKSMVIDPARMNPLMNGADLYWRRPR